MPAATAARRTRRLPWLLIALVAFVAVVFGSHLLTQVLFGAPPPPASLLLPGVLQLALTLVLYRFVRRRTTAVGAFRPGEAPSLTREALVGLAVVSGFAALQLLVVIPATGGAARADVVANLAQLDGTAAGLAGFLGLAVLGALAEEVFVRGMFLRGVEAVAGGGAVGTAVAVALTTVLFALGHGYQGWAGIVDTGLFGGLGLSLLYVWRRSLVAPMIAHAGWNLAAGLWLWSLT